MIQRLKKLGGNLKMLNTNPGTLVEAAIQSAQPNRSRLIPARQAPRYGLPIDLATTKVSMVFPLGAETTRIDAQSRRRNNVATMQLPTLPNPHAPRPAATYN
jgi:hypothetical protein